MTTIQVRIDEKTKRDAQRVLQKLGLDMSSAVKLYLKQIHRRRAIPFLVRTENGFTAAQEEAVLRASEEARQGKNLSRPMEMDEFLRALDVV